MDIPRLIRTLKHLRLEQVIWRARYIAERKLGRARLPAPPHPTPAFAPAVLDRLACFLVTWRTLDKDATARAARFRSGRFRFLNVDADFSRGIDWVSAERPRLWRYQLHYFDCAKECAIAGAPDDAALCGHWQRDWIAANPPGSDVAWDAFTISARLLNWALAAAAWGPPSDEARQSYLLQARYLATHLEHDVQGNHLLKNACALAVASALAWPEQLDATLKLLHRELEEQILADGGHFERSPMYHALVLEDLLVVEAALGPGGDFMRPTTEKMARFLAHILHPDGEIPFFGDSVLGEARRPEVLLGLAGLPSDFVPNSGALDPSGFYTMRHTTYRRDMIIRGGPPGPQHQLGHAHGDLFSFELSLNGKRVLVNSGTHGYADSPHRTWCRSEAAHNTIDVAGDPQLETWGAFRVGARHSDPAVSYTPGSGFRGAALLPLGTTIHRAITVEGLHLHFDDEAAGGPATETVVRLHLAPGLNWAKNSDTWSVLGAGLRVELQTGTANTEPGKFFPEFGVEQANSVLVLRAKGALRYTLTHSPRY